MNPEPTNATPAEVEVPHAARAYGQRAREFFDLYRSVAAEDVHSAWLDLLPIASISVLDVGAGSGRDADWLARLGHAVMAVEPSGPLRELARQRTSSKVEWVADALPGLGVVRARNRSFGVILLSAVWMHVPLNQRSVALATLTGLLDPGGLLVFSIRLQGFNDGREFYPTDLDALIQEGGTLGLSLVRWTPGRDTLGRGLQWYTLVFRKTAGVAPG